MTIVRKRPWTPLDEARLIELAPQISSQRLAVRLRRTHAAVVDRAFQLGVDLKKHRIRRPRRETRQSDSEAAASIGK